MMTGGRGLPSDNRAGKQERDPPSGVMLPRSHQVSAGAVRQADAICEHLQCYLIHPFVQ